MKELFSQSYPESALEHWLCQSESPLPPQKEMATLSVVEKSLVLSAAYHRSKSPLVAVFSTAAEAREAIDLLGVFAGKKALERIHYIPSVDFDYYRGLLPNPETLCERNVGLFHALNDPKKRIFVTSLPALMQKVFSAEAYLGATRTIQSNDEVDRDELVQGLLEAGYQRQPTAFDPGVFSVRGGVIDVFCPLYSQPLRFEFFGDLIEEVRFFEPETQRSLDKVEKAFLIPVGQSLVPRGEDFLEAAAKIKERLDELGIPKATREELIQKVSEGGASAEFSFLFPLLSKGSQTLMDYFPKEATYFWDGRESLLEFAHETEWPRLKKSHDMFEKQPLPIASLGDLFLAPVDLENFWKGESHFFFESFLSRDNQLSFQSEPLSFATERENAKHQGSSHPLLDAFSRRFKDWIDLGYRVWIVCHTGTHAERIRTLFEPYGLRWQWHEESESAFPHFLKFPFDHVHLGQGYLAQSRVFPRLRLVLLSEEELFGRKKRSTKSKSWTSATDAARMLSSFRDLKVHDYVVHREFGIGRYLGLKQMNFQGVDNDYVLLEYRDGDKLYIPIYRLNVLQKYVSGEGAGPALDKLGGDRWAKAKHKASKAVAELAAEFLKIHAKRKLIPAHPFSEVAQDYREFEMEFPFDETIDQQKAIDDVMADLSRSYPMDRLICGDVGYGKTEVAMRAAYRSVVDGKQVAVLVPTTVLALQHFQNFKKRFKSTPTRIEMVSRLKTSQEVKKILAEVSEGKVDVLIGTHRLLSSDVKFKDLGVAIVDEEHRFGVVHKERLKKLTESVHLLTMTATPIPRTLNMAMTGIKEISIITTPPPDRLSVRTFVCRSSPEVIAEAISNELGRDGQVFFVHNRIETIFKVAEELRQILPKVRVEVVHGQMDGETLEQKMLRFYQGDADVLLTTAIIESGLDVPRANTIIIDAAQNFGLAQLYQLRGRVGRSEKRAYCYLLVPSENQMTPDAKQRLQVVQRYTDLGSGFSVASHDLEIRGAGDLLGKEQSGHLAAVGVDMYFELLEESMMALRGEEKKVDIEPEISMQIRASFPTDYLPEVSERILLYRRLSSVESEDQVAEIETEIRDRFGNLPEEVVNLLGLMRIKLYLKKLHVLKMSCGPKRTSLQFAATTPASPAKLVSLLQKDPDKRYSLTPDQKLVFEVKEASWRGQLTEIVRLCHVLAIPIS